MKTKFRVLLVLLIVVFVGVGTGAAQSADLPAEATTALARGAAAVRAESWALAMEYFGEARALVPYYPPVLLNLGIATDRAGGRELEALGWFYAYLAVAPDASNSDQVRQSIIESEIQAETNVRRLLQAAEDAVSEANRSDYSKVAVGESVCWRLYRCTAVIGSTRRERL